MTCKSKGVGKGLLVYCCHHEGNIRFGTVLLCSQPTIWSENYYMQCETFLNYKSVVCFFRKITEKMNPVLIALARTLLLCIWKLSRSCAWIVFFFFKFIIFLRHWRCWGNANACNHMFLVVFIISKTQQSNVAVLINMFNMLLLLTEAWWIYQRGSEEASYGTL